MKRVHAVLISLALLVATPGLANAYPYPQPAGNQQAVNYVIARGLSQRGVPFTYGGGDASGPTRGTDRSASVAGPNPGTGIVGLDPAGSLLGTDPAATVAVPDPAANVIGFDASGLMVYSFAGVGIKLPRSSGEQYKIGRKVLPSQALPGDLIFYGPEGTQSVTLFVGNGQMLEASESGVTVSPIRVNGMAPYLSRIIES